MREFFIRGGSIHVLHVCSIFTINIIDHLLGVWGYAFPEKDQGLRVLRLLSRISRGKWKRRKRKTETES